MPIRDILLDSEGNRVLRGGDYAFADGAQAPKQGVECAVRLFLKEYWLDESQGVDWFGKILVRNANRMVVNGELIRAIASVADVTRVVNTAYVPAGAARNASATYTANTTAGAISGTVTTP